VSRSSWLLTLTTVPKKKLNVPFMRTASPSENSCFLSTHHLTESERKNFARFFDLNLGHRRQLPYCQDKMSDGERVSS
jgi:hypothetical protein